jgi:uncharacterized membrane protein YphA (DoxX/SURF4 family)
MRPPISEHEADAGSIAFRFAFVYFSFYALATQIIGGVILTPWFSFPALGNVWPMRQITEWLAEHVVGLRTPLVFTGNSGDTAFHWIQNAWLLVLALLITAAWTLLQPDQRRDHVWHRWFRLFLRFALAAQMFYYGMAKIIPTQFPPPSLVTLIESVGDLSLSDLLWTWVGASTPYQIFTGGAEMAAGILLLFPRTTTLGALVGVADMLQVFVLNMTYDFGLKQISFHLMLMCLFLLAPDLKRLANVLILNQPAGASTQPPLFATPRTNRIALAAQILVGIHLLVMFSALSMRYWSGPGGPGSPRSPLYGIWNVDELSVDGEVRPASLNDYDRRWRRVIFDAPDVMVLQRTDDSLAHYGVSVDVGARALALTKGSSRTWKASFTFDRPTDDRLVLEGDMDDHRIQVKLRRLELDTFRLLNSSFRWIRPPDPFAG